MTRFQELLKFVQWRLVKNERVNLKMSIKEDEQVKKRRIDCLELIVKPFVSESKGLIKGELISRLNDSSHCPRYALPLPFHGGQDQRYMQLKRLLDRIKLGKNRTSENVGG